MSDQPLPFYPECFVCGTTPTGLQIRFRRTDEGVVYAENYVFPTSFQGFTGVIHGGIQSTVLDEVALWAASLALRDYVLTRELTAKFIRPVKTDTAYNVRGQSVSRDGDTLIAEAALTDAAGKVYTSVRGLFRPMPSKLASEFEAHVTYPVDASSDWRQPRHRIPPTS